MAHPSAEKTLRLAELIHPESHDHAARPDEPQGFEAVKNTMFWLNSVFTNQEWEIH